MLYGQKDCWSEKNYPFIDGQLLSDSIKANKEIEKHYDAIKMYYESMINCKMPKFKAINIDGDSITNETMMGKVVVLNFWFIGCHPCEDEIPYLDSIQKHFKDKNVVFIAITYNEKKDVQRFIKEKNFNFTMIVESVKLIENFMLDGYPETYIFDNKNRFKGMCFGLRFEGDQIEIEKKIRELL